MGNAQYNYQDVRFKTYDVYRHRALDQTLSRHEKIGFTNADREGFSEAILADIRGKLPALNERGKLVVDLGCGCDDLAALMVALARGNGHELYLVDSPEMLSQVDVGECARTRKAPGKFPQEQGELVARLRGKADAVLAYSVLMNVCSEDSVFNFVDRAVDLLAPGGRLLLGDLANRSKRRRFFRSPAGIATHRAYTGDPAAMPAVDPWECEYGRLDDSILFALLMRYRAAGCETYLVPQAPGLPFATRREDVIIERRG